MKTDRTTKILLLLIAAALWVNAMNPWLRPEPVHAQSDVSSYTSGILTFVQGIATGHCSNPKICG